MIDPAPPGRPIRALHICQRDDTAMGGAPRVAVELARRLPQNGVDAHCLFLYGCRGPFGEILGDRAHYLGLKSSREFWNYWKLVRFIAEFQPDLVHHHDPLIWPQVVTACLPGIHKVNHAHNDVLPASQRTLRNHLSCLAGRTGTQLTVAISNFVRDSYVRYNFLPPNRVILLPNGVDAARYQIPTAEQKRAARESFGIPPGKIVIGQVGRLHVAFKGTDDLLKALALLPSDFHGLIAGDGGDYENLVNLAKELGLGRRAVFTGHLGDPLRAFHAMDVFGFTSHYEPFGLVLAEAMACGIPIAGFECPGGASELLSGGRGRVTRGHAPETLAQLILELVADRTGTAEMAERAREFVHARYDWGSLAKQLAEEYRRLLGTAGRTRE